MLIYGIFREYTNLCLTFTEKMSCFKIAMGVCLVLISCQGKGIRSNGAAVDLSSEELNITEGIPLDKEILEGYRNDFTLFSVYKNNTFTLTTPEEGEITGILNYERGLGEDIDATVYVLNFDKPGSERYYVRYTKNDSILVPLNQVREKTGHPSLVKVKRN